MILTLAAMLAGAERSAAQEKSTPAWVAPVFQDDGSDPLAAPSAETTSVDLDTASPSVTVVSSTRIDVPDSGPATPSPANLVVSGFVGPIGHLAVRLTNVNHSFPADLDILLVGPGGQRVLLMSDVGGTTDLDGVSLVLRDGAPPLTTPITSGTYAPTNGAGTDTFPAPAPAGPYDTSLAVFEGLSPNGTWSLYVVDDQVGDSGRIYGFSLIISPQFNNTTVVAVPPSGTSGTTESTLAISGLTLPIRKVTASLHAQHTFDTDLDIFLVAPDGTEVELTSDNGGSGDNYGTGCGAASRTTFDDEAVVDVTAGAAPFVGRFRPEQPLSAFAGKSGAAANGTWRLRVVDDAVQDIGSLQCWSLVIETEEPVQAPTRLSATQVTGNQVTLRWSPPAGGPAPSGYLVEGGVNPGEVLASLPTGSPFPIYTFTAPTGAFYVRVRAVSGGTVSANSDETRIYVNVPIVPSTPADFRQVVTGSTVGLAWTDTFTGGAPTSYALDVTGSAVTTIPLTSSTASAVFSGVPAGSYSLRLRALNAAGQSPQSNAVSVTVPNPSCSGAPLPPIHLLVYKIGGTIFVTWDPDPNSFAATSYLLNVSGSFSGAFPTLGRSLSGTVGPGSYTISVAALNPCGVSTPASAPAITVP